jgi:hypothetical protein
VREYRVTIKGESYLVLAKSGGYAKYQGVKLYRSDNPGRYSFAFLLSIASARLVSPKPSGRHPIMDWSEL